MSASDTVWGAWRDSDIRSWLVEHGHISSEEKANKMGRSELVKMIDSKSVYVYLLFEHIVNRLTVSRQVY